MATGSYAISNDEAIQLIVEEVIANITSIAKGLLDLQSVVNGDASTSVVNGDAVWIYCDNAQCLNNFGQREEWNLQIALIAICKNQDVTRAQQKARSVVARCMSALIKDRRLALSFVQDVRKVRVDFRPTRKPEDATGLQVCGGVMEVKYIVNEKA